MLNYSEFTVVAEYKNAVVNLVAGLEGHISIATEYSACTECRSSELLGELGCLV